MSYYLSQLVQSLSSKNIELERLQKQLEEKKTRLKEVKYIIKDIEKDFDDVIGDIKKVSKKSADNLEDGIKGISKISSLVDRIKNLKEASVERDEHMSGALNTLDAEKRKIEEKISELEDKINTTKGSIRSISNEIDTENRRIQRDAEIEAERARELEAERRAAQSTNNSQTKGTSRTYGARSY